MLARPPDKGSLHRNTFPASYRRNTIDCTKKSHFTGNCLYRKHSLSSGRESRTCLNRGTELHIAVAFHSFGAKPQITQTSLAGHSPRGGDGLGDRSGSNGKEHSRDLLNKTSKILFQAS